MEKKCWERITLLLLLLDIDKLHINHDVHTYMQHLKSFEKLVYRFVNPFLSNLKQ
jgi:hypothetical protein